MRAPSLIAQCLPGLVPHEKGGSSMSTMSERDVDLSSPAVEIIPSKAAHPFKSAGDIDFQGLNMFKIPFKLETKFFHLDSNHASIIVKVSVPDIIGFAGSEMLSSKTDGLLKCCDGPIDLINVLKHEIRDGQLSFRGKRVLELGCSYGIPGIFACLKGASTVHFQDLNAETLRCMTIPNVLANLEQARDRQSRQPESPLTPSRQAIAPSVHFYAGEWEELPAVLSVVRHEVSEVTTGMSQSFSEEDFLDGSSSQDGGMIVPEFSSRRSRKFSRSRAWERACDADQGEGGYDVTLMTEIPYSVTTLKKLYTLMKKCVRPPYGVVYLATKKNCVGFNSAARQLRSLVDEEGIFGIHLVKEIADRDIWKFFLK